MEYDDARLHRIWLNGQSKGGQVKTLGDGLDAFMRQVVAKRRKRLQDIAGVWQELLPAELVEHSCLENFYRGTLRVLVDSGPHLAELNIMVRQGLCNHIRQMCPNVPLRDIKLVRGRWYHEDEQGNRIMDFGIKD